MTTFSRSDPDWTYDDSWQESEREAAPVLEVPCPCCRGEGHASYCTARLEALVMRLSALARGDSGFVVSGATSAAEEPVDDLGIACARCQDSGVVAAESLA